MRIYEFWDFVLGVGAGLVVLVFGWVVFEEVVVFRVDVVVAGVSGWLS